MAERSKSDCECGETHHACDCQIKWRREAEALLREVVDWDSASYKCLKPTPEFSALMRRIRLLLGEDKPDA